MTKKPKPPGVYVRLDKDDLRRVRQVAREMQHDSDARITQSDALRALVRAGLEATDVDAAQRAKKAGKR